MGTLSRFMFVKCIVTTALKSVAAAKTPKKFAEAAEAD